jgi:hypothetical protein
VTDDHWDAIETVLERHGSPLVLETDDGARVVGIVDDGERRSGEGVRAGGRRRRIWRARSARGESECEAALDALHRRRW